MSISMCHGTHDSSWLIKDCQSSVVENASLKETMQWQDKGSTNGSSYNWHKQNPTSLETVL